MLLDSLRALYRSADQANEIKGTSWPLSLFGDRQTNRGKWHPTEFWVPVKMADSELTKVLILLLLLVGFAQLLGWLFVKMRQAKVVGEILAGVVLGNAVIGRLPLAAHFIESAKHQGNILDFVYW